MSNNISEKSISNNYFRRGILELERLNFLEARSHFERAFEVEKSKLTRDYMQIIDKKGNPIEEIFVVNSKLLKLSPCFHYCAIEYYIAKKLNESEIIGVSFNIVTRAISYWNKCVKKREISSLSEDEHKFAASIYTLRVSLCLNAILLSDCNLYFASLILYPDAECPPFDSWQITCTELPYTGSQLLNLIKADLKFSEEYYLAPQDKLVRTCLVVLHSDWEKVKLIINELMEKKEYMNLLKIILFIDGYWRFLVISKKFVTWHIRSFVDGLKFNCEWLDKIKDDKFIALLKKCTDDNTLKEILLEQKPEIELILEFVRNVLIEFPLIEPNLKIKIAKWKYKKNIEDIINIIKNIPYEFTSKIPEYNSVMRRFKSRINP